MTMEYQRHIESEIFPKMAAEEFNALVLSMQMHGFDESFPIILYDAQIVDGWHRYLAAQHAGVEPVFREWQGTENGLRDFIIYANSTRRHLSKAAHAQALIGANATAPVGKRLSHKQIQALTGAAQSTIGEQQRIYDLDPDTAKRVASGEMPATKAVRSKLMKDPDGQDGTWTVKLAASVVAKAKPFQLEIAETVGAFVRTAVEERIERLAANR